MNSAPSKSSSSGLTYWRQLRAICPRSTPRPRRSSVRLVGLIDSETWLGLPVDVKGDIYEGLLARNAEDVKSGAGQYFTPRA